MPDTRDTGISTWKVFTSGLLLYLASVIALLLTGNPNLFPTVVMLGCFLIPVTYVAYVYSHGHLTSLTLPATAVGFVYGGLLGVLAAAVLEPLLIRRLTIGTTFSAGFVEEFAKILGVVIIARRWRHDSEMDGLVLGAAAGMGFAAFESCGYAFTAFLRSGGSLTVTVYVTMLRGILSPLGHGTWTAILSSILFRESEAGRFRVTLKLIGAYITVAVLHGLWDGLPGLITVLFGSGLDVLLAQLFIGLIGVFILWRRWHEARRLQIAPA
jgi:RsiW-degrading membrane proteinase PrsW (M82 family)